MKRHKLNLFAQFLNRRMELIYTIELETKSKEKKQNFYNT